MAKRELCKDGHEGPLTWRMCTNEDGWHCLNCDKKIATELGDGFNPHYDEMHIRAKVESILSDLHHSNIVYMSNSTDGEYTARQVADMCKEKRRFDQYSIVEFIMVSCQSHSAYWNKIGENVRKGKDDRKRCHCGKIAKASSGGKYRCNDHVSELWP